MIDVTALAGLPMNQVNVSQTLNRTSLSEKKDRLLLLLKIFVQRWRSKASFL